MSEQNFNLSKGEIPLKTDSKEIGEGSSVVDQEEIYPRPIDEEQNRFSELKDEICVGLSDRQRERIEGFMGQYESDEIAALFRYTKRNFEPSESFGKTIGEYLLNKINNGSAKAYLEEFKVVKEDMEIEKSKQFSAQEKVKFEKKVMEEQAKKIGVEGQQFLEEVKSDYQQLRNEMFPNGVKKLTVEQVSDFIGKAYEKELSKTTTNVHYSKSLTAMLWADYYLNTLEIGARTHDKISAIYQHPVLWGKESSNMQLHYINPRDYPTWFDKSERNLLSYAYDRSVFWQLLNDVKQKDDPSLRCDIGAYKHILFYGGQNAILEKPGFDSVV